MTMSPELQVPLLTDDDVHRRVASLVGPATQDRCVWLLLFDGDRRQAPVVMPLEDSPRRPDLALVDGLARTLGGLAGILATDGGPGSAVFVLERVGPGTVHAVDTAWAEALATACERAGLGLLGLFTSTRDGVHRVR